MGCEISSNLTIQTPERRQWRRSTVHTVTLNICTPSSIVFIVNFEQVNECLLASAFKNS